jgi:two-component system CheB/CheR fusion protein
VALESSPTGLTEQKQIAAAQRDLDRRKEEFLGQLAHELRNPLASLRNAVHILKMSNTTAAQQVKVSEMMDRQIDRLTRMVDELLEVSRISRGKLQLQKETVDIATVVQRAVESIRPVIDAHGHDLQVTLPSQPLRLQGDPARLEQIISNLLNNAAKASERRGLITVTVSREDGQMVLRVRDNGVGIPPEALPHLFDVLGAGDHLVDHPASGLRIGLALVRGLAELHGGTVQASSRGPGQGSEFVVRLPALPMLVHEKPPVPAEPVPASSSVSARLRVLVVDDNRDAAETIGMLVQLWKYDVRMAHDGPAAVAAAQLYHPDVVLLDIGLPGMNGYQVAQTLRQQPSLDGVVLVAVTGYGQEDDRRRSRQAGFDYHMVKPVDPLALKSLLGGVHANAA